MGRGHRVTHVALGAVLHGAAPFHYDIDMRKDRTPASSKAMRAFTEHALAQVQEVIPNIGYLPPTKRPKQRHILVLSDKPITEVKPNLERIAMADPVGFLSAVMHGQPVQVMKVAKGGTVTTEWHNADLNLRTHIAKHLIDKLIPFMTRLRADSLEQKVEPKDADEEMFRRAAENG